MNDKNSSLITHLSWGNIEVEIGGTRKHFKDCKVWPGGAVEWDWKQTGTHHRPGIQPADVQEILDQGIEILILSRGMQLRLEMSPPIERMLRARRIEYHFLETHQAVDLFNQLALAGDNVGGIFHTTC